jgi:hypothetical protein
MSNNNPVIPAKAGIQRVRLPRTLMEALDPRLRGDDEDRVVAR